MENSKTKNYSFKFLLEPINCFNTSAPLIMLQVFRVDSISIIANISIFFSYWPVYCFDYVI